jgi:hypothetical protein
MKSFKYLKSLLSDRTFTSHGKHSDNGFLKRLLICRLAFCNNKLLSDYKNRKVNQFVVI